MKGISRYRDLGSTKMNRATYTLHLSDKVALASKVIFFFATALPLDGFSRYLAQSCIGPLV